MDMPPEQTPDVLLGHLVSVVNDISEPFTGGIGITLTVGGQIVSGELIPNWQWYGDVERQDRDAVAAAGFGENGALATLFKQWQDGAARARDERKAATEATEPLADRFAKAIYATDVTAFIHLRGARYFTPGQMPVPSEGLLWRGRLSEVAGWSLGTLVATEQA